MSGDAVAGNAATDDTDWPTAAQRGYHRALAAAFGDRVGLAVFLAALATTMLTWRVGVFITDNYTLGNGLVALADGHLHVERAVYGGGLNTPGMHRVDGRAYARNYGQLALALPFLWAFEAAALVADPRVALAACWSLVVLALAVTVGRALDREAALAYAGSAFAVGAFAGNAALATPLDPRWFPYLALQASALVAAAFVGVVLYRTLALLHGPRVGAFAGAATALATPVAFWAPLPKRHVFTTLFAACSLYALVRSRDATGGRAAQYRALAYVPVGLTAWVHAPEALVLLVALALVDVPTAPANDVRSLAPAAAAFLLSLVPFLVTNALISGDPLAPPRLLPGLHLGAAAVSTPTAGGAVGAAAGFGADAGTLAAGVVPPAALLDALGPLDRLLALLGDGVDAALARPERLWRTFVRGGYVDGVAASDGGEAINLAVLESAPLLGALLALPALAADRVRRAVRARGAAADDPVSAVRIALRRAREELAGPARAGDALAATYALLLALVYLPRLPVHAQVTVRYLLPLFAVGAYAVCRLPAVRRAVDEHLLTVAWVYAAGVLVGGQLLLAWFVAADVALGEAVQAHALLGLAVGGALGCWAAAATATDRGARVGAALLGAAAAAGTVFVLLAGVRHFAYAGPHALPLVPGL